MTDIEEKALALIAPGAGCEVNFENISILARAFTSAIEQHEAFRQEVSEVASSALAMYDRIGEGGCMTAQALHGFIIPAPKPDPLLEAMKKAGWSDRDIYNAEPSLRAALDALGFEIREKNDDQ